MAKEYTEEEKKKLYQIWGCEQWEGILGYYDTKEEAQDALDRKMENYYPTKWSRAVRDEDGSYAIVDVEATDDANSDTFYWIEGPGVARKPVF